MDFRFDEDEREIIEQAARTLERDLPAARLLEAGGIEGWRSVGLDGWLGAGLPEEDGGAGLQLSVVAGIGRGAGRVLAGDGFVANAVLLPGLLAGAPELRDVALGEPGFLLVDGRAPGLTPSVASGTPWCFGVEPGMYAYLVADGVLRRYGPEDWSLSPLAKLGLGVGTVALRDGGRAQAEAPLVEETAGIFARASIVHSASLVGLGDQALADTVDYVQQREQFGGPIGRFQAVKHTLADVSVALEIAWSAVLYASLSVDSKSVASARLLAVEAAENATRAMIQFFGGIAMTWEHHAHLYAKTALTAVHRFGEPEDHARRIAAELLKEVRDDGSN